MEAQTLQNRAKMGTRWGRRRGKIKKKEEKRKSLGGVDSRPSIFPEKVAKMDSTWLPKRSQNRLKFDAKINAAKSHKIVPKRLPKASQNRAKIDSKSSFGAQAGPSNSVAIYDS